MDSAQAKQLADSLQGKVIGGWTISGFYGNGKSAVVLPASKDGTHAAIKVFHPELVERYGKSVQLERILRETSLVGAEHPNLVKILDGGECEASGHLYVVMESLPHKNLHEVIADVPLDMVPRLIAQVASAARFLEDRGMAHRDIKPENIAVTKDFSHATLLDLGVLRPIGLSDLTDVDQRSFIGTLRYSSPEFLLRQEADSTEGWRAVTFYQLGAVLHDMLMQRPLFAEHSEPFSQLVEAVLKEVPQIHSTNTRAVTLANHCLVKNPATRLELVSWPDFLDQEPDVASHASAARDRIKQRQKYFHATSGSSAPAADTRWQERQSLDDLCNRLESRVAALMNDLQYFPLRATKSQKDVDAKRCTTCVYFEPDLDKGLPHRLTVMLEVCLIDLNSGSPIFKASGSSVLSEHEPHPDLLYPTKPFFTGEIQDLLDSAALEQQFLDALEGAYAAQEAGSVIPQNNVLKLTKE